MNEDPHSRSSLTVQIARKHTEEDDLEQFLGGSRDAKEAEGKGKEGSQRQTHKGRSDWRQHKAREANLTARGRTEAIAKFVLFVFVFFLFPTNTRSNVLMRLGRAN